MACAANRFDVIAPDRVCDAHHGCLGEPEGNDKRYADPGHHHFVGGQCFNTDYARQYRCCDEQADFEKCKTGDRNAKSKYFGASRPMQAPGSLENAVATQFRFSIDIQSQAEKHQPGDYRGRKSGAEQAHGGQSETAVHQPDSQQVVEKNRSYRNHHDCKRLRQSGGVISKYREPEYRQDHASDTAQVRNSEIDHDRILPGGDEHQVKIPDKHHGWNTDHACYDQALSNRLPNLGFFARPFGLCREHADDRKQAHEYHENFER